MRFLHFFVFVFYDIFIISYFIATFWFGRLFSFNQTQHFNNQ